VPGRRQLAAMLRDMRSTIFRVIALILVALAWASAADPVTAIAFGDSITAATSLPPAERWVDRVAAASGGTLRLVNEGRGGRTSAALADFEQALARTPDARLVIIVLGTNDLKQAPADVAERLAANLGRMVDLAATKLPQARVVLGSPYNINPANLSGFWRKLDLGDSTPARVEAMRDAVKALAAARKLGFIDLTGVIPAASLPDGIHPDAAGHAAIAVAVGAALKP